ncbi:MAG: hypothetical protein EA360_06750 [Balneolaceae bacterium]|nr:MAG: hypothetical protein EA360_06750 [Balneolaceae bacterium]
MTEILNFAEPNRTVGHDDPMSESIKCRQGNQILQTVKTMKNLNRRSFMQIVKAVLSMLFFIWTAVPAEAQTPASAQSSPIAITGAAIHTVSGDLIENGTLLFEDGVITAVGVDIELPAGTEVVDASGKEVWPGLIDAYSQMGIYEIGAVNLTVDVNEQGSVNPNVMVERAFNPESRHIAVARSAGIVVSVTTPGGGLVSGQSAAMLMDGWAWDSMTLKAGVGMIVNWPNASQNSYSRNLETLRDLFAEARAYRKARLAVEAGEAARMDIDIRLEAMMRLFDGTMPVVISANEVRQIQDAVTWAEEEGLRMILLGGRDAHLVTEQLLAHSVPVILTEVLTSPSRNWESFDARYRLPAQLYDAGVQFAIAGIANPANANRLPYEAGAAMAFGLSEEAAVRAVTLEPARILGLGDRLGSLEPGKDASFLITDGNPIEYATQIEQVYIQGRKSDMNDMHRQFYERYSEKVRQMQQDSAQR